MGLASEIALLPYTRLHAFVVLRDLIRKWWRLEVFLTNSRGEPVVANAVPKAERSGSEEEPEQRSSSDGELGAVHTASVHALRPIAPDNDFCRLALHAPTGARRCGESLRVTLDKLRQAGSRASLQIHECHLGFDILASPLWLDGVLQGCVAVSGSVREPLRNFGEEQLLKRVRLLTPEAGAGTDLERALRRVPFLAHAEVDQLADLLQLCATEIANHHAERSRGHSERLTAPGAEEPLIGTAPALLQLQRRLERLAPLDVPVLIQGPPGSGKALCACLLQQRWRSDEPLRRVPCDVQSERALARILFGEGDQQGALDQGGGLLLDHVEALPAVLQDQLASRLARRDPGGPRLYATGADGAALHPALQDLLGDAQLRVPTLTERVEDLPLLLVHFARRAGAAPLRLSDEALAALERYAWPDNGRELRAEVDRLLLMRGDTAADTPVPAGWLSRRIMDG